MIGLRFPVGAGEFSVLQNIHTAFGANPAFFPLAIGGCVSRIKSLRHEASHTYPFVWTPRMHGFIPPLHQTS